MEELFDSETEILGFEDVSMGLEEVSFNAVGPEDGMMEGEEEESALFSPREEAFAIPAELRPPLTAAEQEDVALAIGLLDLEDSMQQPALVSLEQLDQIAELNGGKLHLLQSGLMSSRSRFSTLCLVYANYATSRGREQFHCWGSAPAGRSEKSPSPNLLSRVRVFIVSSFPSVIPCFGVSRKSKTGHRDSARADVHCG